MLHGSYHDTFKTLTLLGHVSAVLVCRFDVVSVVVWTLVSVALFVEAEAVTFLTKPVVVPDPANELVWDLECERPLTVFVCAEPVRHGEGDGVDDPVVDEESDDACACLSWLSGFFVSGNWITLRFRLTGGSGGSFRAIFLAGSLGDGRSALSCDLCTYSHTSRKTKIGIFTIKYRAVGL